MSQIEDTAEQESGLSDTRIGRVRWTICAMLFFATSINYMDRQVIALLKPTLAHTIGLTEINYGYIVDAFQIAYAVGLLVAGRVVDKIGTRIGYIIIMGIWSLSAMGHALASTAFEFGIARFFLGLGESGNFPAAIKTVAEWFPQSERSLATGIFNSGTNVGAILAPLIVPWITIHYGWRAAFLATGVFSMIWISVVVQKLPQAHRSPHSHRHRTSPYLQRGRCSDGPECALDATARISPDLGLRHRQIPHRSHLVVLSLLAALVLQREIQSQLVAPGPSAYPHLQHVRGRQHRRRLAARALSQVRAFGCRSPSHRYARVRLLCGAHLHCSRTCNRNGPP